MSWLDMVKSAVPEEFVLLLTLRSSCSGEISWKTSRVTAVVVGAGTEKLPFGGVESPDVSPNTQFTIGLSFGTTSTSPPTL
jgi:hypothetical protein